MRILIGRAATRYTGRIDAELSLGDVIVMVRPVEAGGTGAVLVFCRGPKGVTPKNWMTDGAILVSELWEKEPGAQTSGELIFEHPSGERLEINFSELTQDIDAPATLLTEKTLLGREQEFSDLLSERLELVEPDLELVEREYRTAAGPIDILAREKDSGRAVAIEVKRKRANRGTAYQAFRYVDALRASGDFGRLRPRAIIVAPTLARGAKEWITEHPELSFVRLGYEDCL